MLISWRKNILYIFWHWVLLCIFFVKKRIWKWFALVKLFVGGSLNIASVRTVSPSRLSCSFLQQWGESLSDSTWHKICLFISILVGVFILYSVHCSNYYSTCFWNCCSFQTVCRNHFSFRALFFPWHHSWWNMLLVSPGASLPSLEAVSGSTSVMFHPSLHSSSAWCHERETEGALCFTSLLQFWEEICFTPCKSTWRELIMLSLVPVHGEGQENQAGESL